MIVYLRLLAGLTSFSSKRCRSHFSSTGPPGIFGVESVAGCLNHRRPFSVECLSVASLLVDQSLAERLVSAPASIRAKKTKLAKPIAITQAKITPTHLISAAYFGCVIPSD